MDTISALEQQAIDAAIENNWEKAIELNTSIIKQDDHNLGGWLRLGFAHLQLKQVDKAAQAYKKALKIQPKHPLATENLERAKILQEQQNEKPDSKAEPSNRKKLDPNLFLDVPGKTKTVQLVNLGQKAQLANLSIGQEVELKTKKRKIEVRSYDGDYIGALPDDVSKRILSFIEEDSVYTTYIKEASLSRVLVFIKEVSKGAAVANYVSFPQSFQPLYHPFHPSEKEGDDADDDKSGAWDDDEDEQDNEDAQEKEDLLHIHTGDDDGDEDDD